jgi:hypothetical protein
MGRSEHFACLLALSSLQSLIFASSLPSFTTAAAAAYLAVLS